MPTEVVVELIRALPTLLWMLFVGTLIAVFYKPIVEELIPNVSGFRAFGFEATFIREKLRVEQKKKQNFTDRQLNQVARRSRRLGSITNGARLLRVDDTAIEESTIRDIMSGLGIDVDTATSTEQALSLMKKNRYDVVVSDMRRDGVADEGLRFLKESVERNLHRPTIFYVMSFDAARGVPGHAFGITNRFDEMLNLVFDALERERG